MNKLKLDKVLLISTFSIILSLFIVITVFNESFVSIGEWYKKSDVVAGEEEE